MAMTGNPEDGTWKSKMGSQAVAEFETALRALLLDDGKVKPCLFGNSDAVFPDATKEMRALVTGGVDVVNLDAQVLCDTVSQLAQNDAAIYYHVLGCMKQRYIPTDAFEPEFSRHLANPEELHTGFDHLKVFCKQGRRLDPSTLRAAKHDGSHCLG